MSDWKRYPEQKPEKPGRYTVKVFFGLWAEELKGVPYADGWNCLVMPDGTIDHSNEISTVTAWKEEE